MVSSKSLILCNLLANYFVGNLKTMTPRMMLKKTAIIVE
jgi:hypothetical protein